MRKSYVQLLNEETGRYELVPREDRPAPSVYLSRVPDILTEDINGTPMRFSSYRRMEQVAAENNATPKIGKGWW